jgi:hypothetical protein
MNCDCVVNGRDIAPFVQAFRPIRAAYTRLVILHSGINVTCRRCSTWTVY